MIRFFLDRHLLVHVITIMVLGLGAVILGTSQREGFPAVTINEVIIDACDGDRLWRIPVL